MPGQRQSSRPRTGLHHSPDSRLHNIIRIKDRKLQNLVLTTAKGVVDTLINNGKIELQSYPKIYQTFKGKFIRVDIDGSNKQSFGCRLKNLEKELLERFKKK